MIDVVDENDKFVRKATRKEVREIGLLHRAAKVIVVNEEGKFLVQKRSMNKDLFPGVWELGVGETVKSGDSYEAAAISGLEDEIGVIGVSNIQLKHSFLFKLRCSSAQNNAHYKVYLLNHRGKVLPQQEEVDEVKFLSLDDVHKLMATGSLEPESVAILKKYVETTEMRR
ncbi:NUDIX domain-containing protein [Candidatus Woesearchaeota archaeon]|nr:NUDIX domain-containing protein [Candidatus Woesearchaeota archaeon]